MRAEAVLSRKPDNCLAKLLQFSFSDRPVICPVYKGWLLPNSVMVCRVPSGRGDGLRRGTILLWWEGFDRIVLGNRAL